MKKLITVRHGPYDYEKGFPLSDLGRIQMGELAEELKTIIGWSVFMITSTARRAKESAQILALTFGINYEESEVLWVDHRRPLDEKKIMKLIYSLKDKAENLVVVTHLEVAAFLPVNFAKKALGVSLDPVELLSAEASILDLESRSLFKVE